MSVKNLIKTSLTLMLLSLFPVSVMAEQYKSFGPYIVHYNALQTDFLSSRVAAEYGIKRSKNRAMLNIVVQKKGAIKIMPSEAEVMVTATNLSGQLRTITMRPVRSGQTIYYIGEFSVGKRETLRFKISVKPAGSSETYTVKYSKAFYSH